MNENKEVGQGVELGILPVNQESSVETPDKENEELNTETDGAEGAPETSAEENKVSYSRFSNINQRRKEAERRAWELEREIEELKQRREVRKDESDDIPAEWFELTGGDTPQSRKAYQILRNTLNPSEDKIRQLAEEAYYQAEVTESRRVSENERTIDDQLEDVSISLGRDLSDDEEVALLEIMDEYSAKDEENNIYSLFPAEKAWEIYEMQSGSRVSSRKMARDRAASMISSPSQGEPALQGRSKANKDFDPSWGAWEGQLNKFK